MSLDLSFTIECLRVSSKSKFPLVPPVLPRILNGRLDECPRVAQQAKRVLVLWLSAARSQIEPRIELHDSFDMQRGTGRVCAC